MRTPEQTVRDAWHSIAGSRAPQQLALLLQRYSEPHRRYHTVVHLAAVLDAIDRIAAHTPPAQAATDLHAVMLAALFHDAVYEPRSATNEADSARMAGESARELGWAEPRCSRVEALVMATAGHVAPSRTTAPGEPTIFDPDEALLLDADLSILAAPAEQYREYTEGVRGEYAEVSDEQWRVGRAQVLRTLLERPALFTTSYMLNQAEAAARGNMHRELATLTNP